MQGIVKWFSSERGYGFINGEDGHDYHCSVKQVKGAVLPVIGSEVQFDAVTTETGLRAKNVIITSSPKKESKEHYQDDRVTCAHCYRRMIPRLQYDRGTLVTSICPFCACTYRDFEEHFELPEWLRKSIKFVALSFLGLWVFLWLLRTAYRIFGN